MKNVSSKKYARALYELLQAADGEKERARVMTNFFSVAAANRDTGKLNDIVRALTDVYDEAAGTLRGTLVTAHKLAAEDIEMIKRNVAAAVGKAAVEMEIVIDETLIGGFRAVFKDRIVDATVRGQIHRLKQVLA